MIILTDNGHRYRRDCLSIFYFTIKAANAREVERRKIRFSYTLIEPKERYPL